MQILIVAPAWVGDMVMAHTLVQTLAQVHPDAQVHMIAPPATAPIAERMPGVASVTRLEVGHGELGIGTRWRVARSLPHFDQAILLPNTIKSVLVPLFAGIPRRTGWVGESRYGLLNDIRKLDPERYPLMIERFMALGVPEGEALARPYPKPRLSADADRRKELMREHGLSEERPVALLCPGAEFGPAKQWPEAHYASVAEHLVRSGHQVWLMGSPKDQAVSERIASAAAEPVTVLAGATSLTDAVDLMSGAVVAVSNDSGLMHVAAALGVPVVGVYGSTSPEFTPPLHDEAQVVRLGLECSPCFQRTCPLGHLNCLNDLAPERVIACLPR